MTTLTLNIPNVNVTHITLVITVVLVVAAVLASILLEVYRRHYNKKKLEQLGKAATAILLTALSAAFTSLGYLIFIVQNNTPFLSTLPFVGKHIAAVVGIAYILYNLRLNKWYKSFAKVAGKWSGVKNQTQRLPQPTESPVTDNVGPDLLQ